MKGRKMNSLSLLIAFLVATPALADTSPTTTTPAPTAPVSSGPQLTGNIKLVRLDGMTVIQQGKFGSNVAVADTLTVAASDAFVKGNGRCAFNLRYEETSAAALNNSTNRIFSNDTLIAQNTAITLLPKIARAVVTQPYLFAGLNNVKFVLDADDKPSTFWVRINVTGTCGSAAPAPVVVSFKPGSAEWNRLFVAFGYSNYGVTQLKTKAYARYADLVKLNADITAAVQAGSVTSTAFASLMTRWDSFLNDAAFRAAMTSVTPGTPGVK
jgi:hypothetical protein